MNDQYIEMKTVFWLALIAFYIYSTYKKSKEQANKKIPPTPTPSAPEPEMPSFEEILKEIREKRTPKEPTVVTANKENKTESHKPLMGPEKEKEPQVIIPEREFPFLKRKQLEQIKENDLSLEKTSIEIKNYDKEIQTHELPHLRHPLSQAKKEEEIVQPFEFDARQAFIYSEIINRKEF